ncbi:MAG: hypothetical protein KGI47_10470 [Betaproteobacteria bacterium]|nr:hypothetical protein [Betaproteobacteria bacterium]
MSKQISDEAFIEAWNRCGGSPTAVSKDLGIGVRAVYDRRNMIEARCNIKLKTNSANPAYQNPAAAELQSEIRTLKAQLDAVKRETLDQEYVRRKIFKMAEANVTQPSWLLPAKAPKGSPGVPTLLASDWHWGEIVDPSQINGVNEYNLEIAHRRARRLIETTISLLKHHMVNPDYPGIVFALGGDMVSGDIHEELMATNEVEIMPVVLDLFGVLCWCIETLVDHFGRAFVPCVGGNHGRNTHKIRAKGRNHTSFDWLLYCFLAKRFEGDKRVTFQIPNGSDASFAVYGHRYLLTHGDQFRGGDGVIGALGPIIRGDHRKRTRQSQIGSEYDTMLLGHWHQLIQLRRLIVNGSLVGYNEYAYINNFPYEPPQQALWLTHPERGITFSMPVQVEGRVEHKSSSWVSWVEVA